MGRMDEHEPDIIRRGPVPVYQQVAAILRRRIQSGKLGPHERLPSESDIVGTFGVSRGSARHAIQVLREEGWIYTRPQMGSFALPREDWPQPS
jgi:GntR family transcriptional regulator